MLIDDTHTWISRHDSFLLGVAGGRYVTLTPNFGRFCARESRLISNAVSDQVRPLSYSVPNGFTELIKTPLEAICL